jgi:hypothetical protein
MIFGFFRQSKGLPGTPAWRERYPPPRMGADADPWHRIAEIARFAPTPHNTQPFRIRRLGSSGAEVVALRERLLPKEDHLNLYMTSAVGIFCETIERAGAAIGLRMQSALEASLDPATLHQRASTRVATVEIEGRMDARPDEAERVTKARRTSRLPYVSLTII